MGANRLRGIGFDRAPDHPLWPVTDRRENTVAVGSSGRSGTLLSAGAARFTGTGERDCVEKIHPVTGLLVRPPIVRSG